MNNSSDKCTLATRVNNIIHKIKYYSTPILLLALTPHASNAQDAAHNQTISNYLEVFNIVPLNGNIKHVKKQKIVRGDTYITELFFDKNACLKKIRETTEDGLIESNPTGLSFYKIIDGKKLKHITQNKNCQVTSLFDYYNGHTIETNYTYTNGRISGVNNKIVKTIYFYHPDNLINKYIVKYDPSMINRTETFIYKYNTKKNLDNITRVREDIMGNGEKESTSVGIHCTNPDGLGNPTKCIADDDTLFSLMIDYYE